MSRYQITENAWVSTPGQDGILYEASPSAPCVIEVPDGYKPGRKWLALDGDGPTGPVAQPEAPEKVAQPALADIARAQHDARVPRGGFAAVDKRPDPMAAARAAKAAKKAEREAGA